MLTSEQLLREFARNGSEEHYRDLVRRHLDLVYGTAVRLSRGDRHLAEDVSQIVFTDLASRADSVAERFPVGGWLYRHTCFTTLKMLRTEIRRSNREELFQSGQTITSEPTAPGESLEMVVDELLNTLPETDRCAVVLRFLSGLDLKSVGRSLGISEGAAQKRVGRALEKMREIAEKRGLALSTSALAIALGTLSSAAAAPPQLLSRISSAPPIPASAAAKAGTLGLTGKLAFVAAVSLAAALAILIWRSPVSPPTGGTDGAIALFEKGGTNRSRGDSQASVETDLAERLRLMRERRQLAESREKARAAKAEAILLEKISSPPQLLIQWKAVQLPRELAAHFKLPKPGGNPAQPVLLGDADAATLIDQFEKASGVDLLGSPRMTMASGIQGSISVSEEKEFDGVSYPMGPNVKVFPNIQPGGESISLTLDTTINLPETEPRGNKPPVRSLSAQMEVVVRDGEAVLFGGWPAPRSRPAEKEDGQEITGNPAVPEPVVYVLVTTQLINERGEPLHPRDVAPTASFSPAE
jgi:RNA polymerase sigma factor (sigma-70 family)